MSLTVQFILTIVLGYFAVAAIKFLGTWLVVAPVALERKRAIEVGNLQNQVQRITAISTSGYSQAQLAKLARLLREGNELFNVEISQNSVNGGQVELDAWLTKHSHWRESILSILIDRDAAIFEGPTTAGAQPRAMQRALNQTHGLRRGQLLDEMDRVARVLEHNSD